MNWAIVHYWESRWAPSQPTKSLAGHMALETAMSYVSWSPSDDGRLAAVFSRVSPNPRTAYLADAQRAGGSGPPLHSHQVRLIGLDVEAIDAAWRGKATHLADPAIQGPPIAYSLVPSARDNAATSCATLVLQLLMEGGAGDIVPYRPNPIVTPRAIYDYALRLQAQLARRTSR